MAAPILPVRDWVVKYHRLLFAVLAGLNGGIAFTIFHQHPYVALLSGAMALVLVLVAVYL